VNKYARNTADLRLKIISYIVKGSREVAYMLNVRKANVMH